MGWIAKNTGGFITLNYSSETGAAVTPTAASDMNCNAAWAVYSSLGWSKNAVAAVLGVQAYESGLNPWRWQSDEMISKDDYYNLHTSTEHGYGLNQFTPAWTYIGESSGFPGFGPNYSDQVGLASDGSAQCYFIEHACADLGYYFKWSYAQADYDTYPYIPFADFKITEITDFTYLVNQWLWNYSRGIAEHGGSLEMRVAAAEYIYTILGGMLTPVKPWIRTINKRKLLGRQKRRI